MAGGINGANFRKALFFLKRNGIKNTCYAILERLADKRQPLYHYNLPEGKELARQREESRRPEHTVTFSIVVPCYHTDEKFLREMIHSVCRQTYPRWELILADATEDESVARVVETLQESRLKYIHLAGNNGIAENTNCGIREATGEYVGLLDHDDLLTEDALYEMAMAVEAGQVRGKRPRLLYSDEDKCDGEGRICYDPNFKEDFNLDLLLSNNYICHFMVMERKLMYDLLMRREFDGSQDYDLVLRAAAELSDREDHIVHVPKVLYHWRCHVSSTAENPQSKLYAYDAGRRAVQSFAERRNWAVKVKDTVHLGFYRLVYPESLFAVRKDVGAVGGPLFYRGRIWSGRLSEEGKVYYEGLNCHYSGYLHRAALQQDAEAVDIRNLQLREEVIGIFERVTGVPYRTLPKTGIFDVAVLPSGTDMLAVSLALGKALRAAGYRILYLPERGIRLRSVKGEKNF